MLKVKKRAALFCLPLMLFAALAAMRPDSAAAASPSGLKAALSSLLAEASRLAAEAHMGAVESSQTRANAPEIPADFRFTRTLRLGARGEDVRYLQILLNRDSETRVNISGETGGPGRETARFGSLTQAAVARFQHKYRAQALAPAGLANATGIVGPVTRLKLNALLAALPPAGKAAAASPPAPLSTSTSVAQTAAAPTPVQTAAAAPAAASFEDINRKTRAALVNVLCTTKRGGSFLPISGSGVTIDPRGVILTNAHVAQYLLLKDYLVQNFVECLIRTGEPAVNRYKASLLYLSPQWVKQNYASIAASRPTGTGEHDFALLRISGTVNPANPLPSSFDYVPPDWSDDYLRVGNPVLEAAYPAEFLSGINIQKDLYPTSSVNLLNVIFSFGASSTPDLIGVSGTPVAEAGSSGGAFAGASSSLVGLIATASEGHTTGERSLHALTLAYINRDFAAVTGFSIPDMLLQANLEKLSSEFNEKIAPPLRDLLVGALSAR